MQSAIGCASLAVVALLTRQCLRARSTSGQSHQLYQDEDGIATQDSAGKVLKITSANYVINVAATAGVASSILDARSFVLLQQLRLPAAAALPISLWVCSLKMIQLGMLLIFQDSRLFSDARDSVRAGCT